MTCEKDGGPAFPAERAEVEKWADGSPAHIIAKYPGMSMRDWFAGQALAWAGHNEWLSRDPKHLAERAYRMADAMLEARK